MSQWTAPDTGPGVLESVLTAADNASAVLARSSLADRARWLNAIADALEAHRGELIGIAHAETHLLEARLTGEVTRTAFQLRLVATAVLEGSWLEATIDHDDPYWPMGPRPDLRRFLRPLGPVLVVAASNFPFAFSVAGGDTATALGSGCPVILKAHPGHPKLSRRTAELVIEAVESSGAPRGTFALIESEEDAQTALRDHRVQAGSFTGSIRGGRLLHDIATARPIPFYGELGSVNPVFVLPSAIRSRRRAIVDGFVDSFTLGTGQFCTKPGVMFVPRTDGLLLELAERAALVNAPTMLNERIESGYRKRLKEMNRTWQPALRADSSEDAVAPTLFTTTLADAHRNLDALFDESFGPTSVVVTYDDPADLPAVARSLPGQLTTTIHAEEGAEREVPDLVDILATRAGRIVWNGWPTGVTVSWAMHHGGTWPATTASVHTSVGPSALRRFVTPVAYQNVPASLLPEAVREDNPQRIWQRIDGQLTPAAESKDFKAPPSDRTASKEIA